MYTNIPKEKILNAAIGNSKDCSSNSSFLDISLSSSSSSIDSSFSDLLESNSYYSLPTETKQLILHTIKTQSPENKRFYIHATSTNMLYENKSLGSSDFIDVLFYFGNVSIEIDYSLSSDFCDKILLLIYSISIISCYM